MRVFFRMGAFARVVAAGTASSAGALLLIVVYSYNLFQNAFEDETRLIVFMLGGYPLFVGVYLAVVRRVLTQIVEAAEETRRDAGNREMIGKGRRRLLSFPLRSLVVSLGCWMGGACLVSALCFFGLNLPGTQTLKAASAVVFGGALGSLINFFMVKSCLRPEYEALAPFDEGHDRVVFPLRSKLLLTFLLILTFTIIFTLVHHHSRSVQVLGRDVTRFGRTELERRARFSGFTESDFAAWAEKAGDTLDRDWFVLSSGGGWIAGTSDRKKDVLRLWGLQERSKMSDWFGRLFGREPPESEETTYVEFPNGDFAVFVPVPDREAVFGAVYPLTDLKDHVAALMLNYAWILLFCAAVTLGITFMTYQDILGPIADVRAVAEAVVAGDLARRPTAISEDETGTLVLAMSRLAEAMEALDGNLRSTAKEVVGIASEADHLAGELEGRNKDQMRWIDESARLGAVGRGDVQSVLKSTDDLRLRISQAMERMERISRTADEMKKGTDTFKGSFRELDRLIESLEKHGKNISQSLEWVGSTGDETAAAANEIEISVRSIRENAAETEKLVMGLDQAGKRGSDIFNALQKFVGVMQSLSGEVTSELHSLSAESEKINRMIEGIEDVAENTNLLSLNAAIIAANSGEFEREFSVVVEEIKALAQRSTGYAEEIKTIVRNIAVKAQRSYEAALGGKGVIEEGVDYASRAQGSFRDVLARNEQSRLMIRQILEASKEQQGCAQRVNEYMVKLNTGFEVIIEGSRSQQGMMLGLLEGASRMRAVETSVVDELSTQKNAVQKAMLIVPSMLRVAEALRYFGASQLPNLEDIHMRIGQLRTKTALNSRDGEVLERNIREFKDQAEQLLRSVGAGGGPDGEAAGTPSGLPASSGPV